MCVWGEEEEEGQVDRKCRAEEINTNKALLLLLLLLFFSSHILLYSFFSSCISPLPFSFSSSSSSSYSSSCGLILEWMDHLSFFASMVMRGAQWSLGRWVGGSWVGKGREGGLNELL